MKYPALILALALAACSTAQLNTAQSIVDPVAVALVSGYGQTYGVPPSLTTAVLTPILNDGWGMVAQAQAGQPVAQGAAIPTIGTTVAATNPTAAQLVSAIGQLTLAKSNPKLASAIITAAGGTPAPPTSAKRAPLEMPTLYYGDQVIHGAKRTGATVITKIDQ